MEMIGFFRASGVRNPGVTFRGSAHEAPEPYGLVTPRASSRRRPRARRANRRPFGPPQSTSHDFWEPAAAFAPVAQQ